MPIAFACPHCGKQTTVADQFAGQSGPCAACGRTITIPVSLPAGSYSGPPRSSSGGSGALIGVVVALSAVALVVIGCAGVGWFALRSSMAGARTAAGRMRSMNNLKMIAIAMHNYHDMYQELPPAVVKDAEGKPLYSGMVLLLPFLEQEHLFRQYDLSKPWNAPENQVLSAMDIPVFKNPASPSHSAGSTDYLFVGGPQSLLDSGQKASFASCQDGTSNTIVFVEVRGNTRAWAEPQVWTPDQPLDSDTPNVVLAATADGAVHALNKNTPQQQLILLSNPRDGTPVSIP